MGKQELSTAVKAVMDKDYVKFRETIKGELEDRLKSAQDEKEKEIVGQITGKTEEPGDDKDGEGDDDASDKGDN